jgi:catechol 2,3-dioxygenase-like lactoylglutathione lyase family enzyme
MDQNVYFNHLGHTVVDIARSQRFYEELLGFRFWWDFKVPDELSSKVLMVPPPVGLTATYLWRPDLTLNLMHFGDENAQRVYRERKLNEPGYSHIALSVEDHAGVLARVPELGGEVLQESMGPASAWGTAVFIRDPDRQLIEIVSMDWRREMPPPPSD